MSEDLKVHAASSQDFYALLDLSPAASESEIRRAYRRTALKYHPDKISNPTQSDFEKFHLLQIANDVLSDPSVRQLYDNAREARMRKQRERDMMNAAERKMREELEAGERAAAASRGGPQGVKRPWSSTADDAAEAELQRKIEQIQEDVRQRRVAMQEKRQREMEEENKQTHKVQEEAQSVDQDSQRGRPQEGSVSEEDRSVKVRWVRDGRGLDLGADWLRSLLAPFGKVEHTVLLKDKRVRVEGKKSKVTLGTGLVVFASIVHAHAAVLDSKQKIRQADGDWTLVESVAWAFGNGPDLKFGTSNDKTTTEEPSSTNKPATSTTPSFPFPGAKPAPKDGKAPTFGSFASAAASMNAPKASSFKPSAGGAPSFEEETLMRLRAVQREKEERKALEDQIAREDAAADAAEAEAEANGS